MQQASGTDKSFLNFTTKARLSPSQPEHSAQKEPPGLLQGAFYRRSLHPGLTDVCDMWMGCVHEWHDEKRHAGLNRSNTWGEKGERSVCA